MHFTASAARWLQRRAENILAFILALLFATFLVQIASRYVFNFPMGWTVEVVAIAWIWIILFGYAFVVRDDEAIRLDFLYGELPTGWRRGLDAVTNAICAGILAWTFPEVLGYVEFVAIEKTSYLGLPLSVAFSVYLVFTAAVILRCVRNVWRALTGRGYDAVAQGDAP